MIISEYSVELKELETELMELEMKQRENKEDINPEAELTDLLQDNSIMSAVNKVLDIKGIDTLSIRDIRCIVGKQSAQYQRSLMSRSLRYDVMKKDGFRCVICGKSASDGIKLHIDHIIPVSKGGKTELNNLRTLCEDCNRGKRDKYDESGIN